MSLEEIRAALEEALPLRSPRFAPEERPATKIAALEDHMLACAEVNGSLVEARHWLRFLRARLADEWEKLEGWQMATDKARARLTAADINRAKIRVAPTQYEAGREAKRLSESIDDQIVRLEREEKVCSRAYSLISGK